jgi:hypothetical protein
MNLKYFHDEMEYPRLLWSGVEFGVYYRYIASYWLPVALLEGGLRPEAMWLMERYRPHDPAVLDLLDEPRWLDVSRFDDDVVMLIRCRERSAWGLLRYDCDVSDCEMGFFRTSDDEATIAATVDDWLRSRATPHEIEENTDSGDSRVFRMDVSRIRIGVTVR